MKNLPFLDSLRGIAGLYVVMFHVAFLPQPNLATPDWAREIVHLGDSGVTLFFVISAFSLCYTMPVHLQSPSPLLSFFLRRFFRIAPLFYVWIVLSLLRDDILYSTTHSLAEVLASFLLVFNVIPGFGKGFVWASWTIGVEMMFYLLFPLLFRFARDLQKAVLLLLLAMLLWFCMNVLISQLPLDPASLNSLATWIFVRHLPIFIMGVIAYVYLRKNFEDGRQSVGAGLVLVGGAACGYAALLNGWLCTALLPENYWQGIVYALLLLGLALNPLRLFVNRVTRFYGKISYSVYLNHPTIVVLLIPVYREIYQLQVPTTAQFLAALLVTYGLVTLAAVATYHLIERPGIDLGRRLFAATSRLTGH